MYIRFVIESIDENSLVRRGVIIAAHELKDEPSVLGDDRQALCVALRWLDEHLASPPRFNRTKSKGYYRRRSAAISWLKDTAEHHLARMREISDLLEKYGHHVTMLKESHPGYVVYEDEHQLVAEPFSDSMK